MIRIDLNKALEIHQNKIRSKREELFKTLPLAISSWDKDVKELTLLV